MPALALDPSLHKLVGIEQRALGVYTQKQIKNLSVLEIIERNITALQRAGVAPAAVRRIRRAALLYARKHKLHKL